MYRRMQEMELAQQRNLAQYQRQNDLEDRRYRQEAIRELPDVQQDSPAFSALNTATRRQAKLRCRRAFRLTTSDQSQSRAMFFR